MTKLNQIIAVVNGKKSQCQKELTSTYKRLQKPELFDGLVRVYSPDDEEGETQPSETKRVQFTVSDAIQEASELLTEMMDAVATQEYANTQAFADVVVDGKTVLGRVPVSYLLFLEKQLVDLNTFVSHIPTLDNAEEWHDSEEANVYKTLPKLTNRTKKVPRNHVLAEATDKHPAQVQVFTEDVKVGVWSTIKLSGAVPSKRKTEFLSRIKKLQEAVKMAREEANSTKVESQKVAKNVLSFIFE